MTYWIFTDSHCGHEKMFKEFKVREAGYEEKIFSNLSRLIKPTDIFIHLGDVCWGNDEYWNKRFADLKPFRAYLIRGNHDSKSNHYYLTHGWSAVCESMTIRQYGKIILFSHVPVADCGYDLNVHGHFHNNDHRKWEPELLAIRNPKQHLVAIENTSYSPVSLKFIIDKLV